MPKRRPKFDDSEFKVGRVTVFRDGVKGGYRCRYSNPHTKRETLHTFDYDEAYLRASDINAKLARGTHTGPVRKRKLADAVSEFLAAKTAERRKYKTLNKYANELNALTQFLGKDGIVHLEQVNAVAFDQYQIHRSKTRSEKSIETEVTLLKGFFKWCVERDYLVKNPLRSCKIPVAPEIVHLTPEPSQVEALLSTAWEQSPLLHAIIAVKAFAGMRVGEVVAIRPVDVDLVGGWIHVRNYPGFTTKSGRSRKIPVHPRLLAILKAYVDNHKVGPERFFRGPPYRQNRKGMPHLNPRWVNSNVVSIATSLGIPAGRDEEGLVAHGFRKFFRTRAKLALVPDEYADRWVDHQPRNKTRNTYIGHSDEESQRLMRSIPFDPPAVIMIVPVTATGSKTGAASELGSAAASRNAVLPEGRTT